MSRKGNREPATVPRLLTKRTHIVSILLAAFAAAALAVPAAALGANGDSDAIGGSKAKPLSVAAIAPPAPPLGRDPRLRCNRSLEGEAALGRPHRAPCRALSPRDPRRPQADPGRATRRAAARTGRSGRSAPPRGRAGGPRGGA